MKYKRILLAGEGGQGIQAIAKIFTAAAFAQKLDVTFLPNFGVEQRGGVSLAFIQISDGEISFPKFKKADILMVLSERALKRSHEYLTKESVVIFDNSLVTEKNVSLLNVERMGIPALRFAQEKLVPKVFNMTMLGALSAELEVISEKNVKAAMKDYFSQKLKKEPELKHFNEKALEVGIDTAKMLKKDVKWRKKVLTV